MIAALSLKIHYFVDHVNKKTQWEDPRLNHPFIWGDKETNYLRQLMDGFNDVTESTAREALLT
uniref:WW domain-containing protein n=1 Tax=Romanomermis culicivorax TaxID=13658 RepID=A0A915IZA9_ROMCU